MGFQTLLKNHHFLTLEFFLKNPRVRKWWFGTPITFQTPIQEILYFNLLGKSEHHPILRNTLWFQTLKEIAFWGIANQLYTRKYPRIWLWTPFKDVHGYFSKWGMPVKYLNFNLLVFCRTSPIWELPAKTQWDNGLLEALKPNGPRSPTWYPHLGGASLIVLHDPMYRCSVSHNRQLEFANWVHSFWDIPSWSCWGPQALPPTQCET